MKAMKYEYQAKEQTVDTRVWTIESDRQLTEDEVNEIYRSRCDDMQEEIPTTRNDIRVTYVGTDYGDDSQSWCEGDFKGYGKRTLR